MSTIQPAKQQQIHQSGTSADIFRSKLFSLDQHTNKWIDKGIGFPKIIQTTNNNKERYMLKFILASTKAEILSEALGQELIIENPKEKQITFSNDTTEEDIALSFENEAGRLALWKQIREAKGDMTQQQQEDEFSTYKEQFDKMETENTNHILPLPTSVNALEQFLHAITDAPIEDRNIISSEIMVRQIPMFKAFSEQFSLAEKYKNEHVLRTLYAIFKELVFFTEHELLLLLLSNDHYLLTFGILEYDNEQTVDIKKNHRDFFQKQAKYQSALSFRDSSKVEEVHFCFRLQYLRDSALAHIIDDATLNILNIITSRISKGIVQYVITNRELMTQLSSALGQKDYIALCQIHEMFLSVKTLDIFQESQADIYDSFQGIVIFDILESFLSNYDKPNQGNQMMGYGFQRKKQQILTPYQLERVPYMIVQILLQYMTNKPYYLLDYMSSNEQKFQGYRFFSLLCNEIMHPRYQTSQLYFNDLLRVILENSLKDIQYEVFVDQFSVVHLPRMLGSFENQEFSEELNSTRFLILDLIAATLGTAEVLSSLPAQALQTFQGLPNIMSKLFQTNQKCLCSAILRLFQAFIDSEKPELHAALAPAVKHVIEYLIKKIHNKTNLIYSEIIKFVKMTQTSSILASALQDVNQQFENNSTYKKFILDVRKTIPPENNSPLAPSSLFNSENVRLSLDSHKRFDSQLDGEDIDIDYIRKGSPPKTSPNSKSQSKQSRFSSQDSQSVQGEQHLNESDDPTKEATKKRFKGNNTK